MVNKVDGSQSDNVSNGEVVESAVSTEVEVIQANSDQALQTAGFDYSEFSNELREKILDSVRVLKFEYQRTAEQVIRVGAAISTLRELAGGKFSEICKAELPNVHDRSLRRYEKAFLFAKEHGFTNNLQLIGASVIYTLMSDNTSAEVIEFVQEKLANNENVSNVEVEALKKSIAENEKLENQLSDVQNENLQLKKDLKVKEQVIEANQAALFRLQESNNRLKASEERVNKEVSTLTHELNELTVQLNTTETALITAKNNPEIKYETVEVLPKGYTDAQLAIEQKNRELEEKQEQLKLIKQQLFELEINKKAMERNNKAVAELTELCDQLLQKYPSTVLISMNETVSDEIKDHLKTIAKSFITFGNNISDSLN